MLAVPLAVTVVTGVVVRMLSRPKADATAALALVTLVASLTDPVPSLAKPALSAAIVVTGLTLTTTVPPFATVTAMRTVSRLMALPVASSR